MSDSPTIKCGRCGAHLPADAPMSFCLRCLVREGADLLRRSAGQPRPLTRHFGDYEILDEIARGGMGVVYRARQLSVNRLVALKMILRGEFASEESRQRFVLEAQSAARLDHPNIVPIYEVGECDGLPFFTMKLMEGGTLATRSGPRPPGASGPADGSSSPGRGAPMGVRTASQLLATIARAVHFAHQRGVLHRDLKPGNILLDAQGQPHLTDFGLAKLAEEDSGLTRTLAVLGSPSYMSPEQARGETKHLTIAADVYGLGAIYYELLTGRPPFAGQTATDTVRQVLDDEPQRPSLHRPGLPSDVETICLKCLEKNPARRYGTAEALAVDLERWLRSEPILARPVPPGERAVLWVRRHKVLVAAIGSVAVALIAGLTVSLWQAVRATRAEADARRHLATSLENEKRATAAEAEANERASAALMARRNSEAVSIFLMNVFGADSAGRDGHQITVAEKLAAAERDLSSLYPDPADQKQLLLVLGRSYLGLGLPREALPSLTRYRDYCRDTYGPDNAETLGGSSLVATALERTGRTAEARQLREEVLHAKRRTLGPDHESTITSINRLADHYAQYGSPTSAIPLFAEARRQNLKLHGPHHPDTLEATANLADMQLAVGQFDEAIALREELVTQLHESPNALPGGPVRALDRLALACFAAGQIEAALRHWHAASLRSEDPIFNLKMAGLQAWFGDEDKYTEIAERRVRSAQGSDSSHVANCVAKLASLAPLSRPGIRQNARQLARAAVQLGQGDPLSPWFQLGLGMSEYRNGDYAHAAEALWVAEKGAAAYDPRARNLVQGTARLYRALCLVAQGQAVEARELLAEVSATMKPLPPDRANPLADGADHDDLILWLAFKEAQALLR